MTARHLGRSARRAVVLAASAGAVGCLKDEPSAVRPAGDVVAWSFPAEREPPLIALWPPSKSTPRRSKRHLQTRDDDRKLEATVEGNDPYFFWQFAEAERATGVRVALSTDRAGMLQLFWTDAHCPVFSETCSTKQTLSSGAACFAFILDGGNPVRELRLDVTDQVGARFTFESIDVLRSAELDVPWVPSTGVELVPGSSGLFVRALEPDPWLIVPTPGLDATEADTIEVTMRGAGGASPQLFWAGACGDFAEECSVQLTPADAGALTHRARLADAPRWKGAVSALRFDPGPDATDYVIERIALGRSAAPAKPK